MKKRKTKKIKDELRGEGRILPPLTDVSDSSEESTNHLHPAFCFKSCQQGFSVTDCDNNEKVHLLDKIYRLCNISWGEIQKKDRKGLGHETIAHNSIVASLPKNTPGDRKFLAFRMGGSGNSIFMGHRKGKIFYVTWIDPKGKVYKHN